MSWFYIAQGVFGWLCLACVGIACWAVHPILLSCLTNAPFGR